MKNHEQIYHKKKLIAFIVRDSYFCKQTKFLSKCQNSLQFGYIVKKKNDIIKRHKHKKIKRIIIGTPEILIVKSGETIINIFIKGKEIKSTILKKGDVVALIDCEHSFFFKKKTVLQEIKQGPYIKNEKIIYD